MLRVRYFVLYLFKTMTALNHVLDFKHPLNAITSVTMKNKKNHKRPYGGNNDSTYRQKVKYWKLYQVVIFQFSFCGIFFFPTRAFAKSEISYVQPERVSTWLTILVAVHPRVDLKDHSSMQAIEVLPHQTENGLCHTMMLYLADTWYN